MSKLNQLKPTPVWEYFETLCGIPHPSKKETKLVAYLKEFGERLGLKTLVDATGNVIIKKPACPGYENRQGIVLQAHLDMVPQKNNDKKHDFEKDPIEPVVDGDWVRANGTTLGADNGIGIAAMMAIMAAKDLKHGPLEALLTVDEEAGMTGASGLKPGLLEGSILLNLDSEEEGELFVGCAGGLDAVANFTYTEESLPSNAVVYQITISGLRGGHSGMDIALGRGNANKLLNRFVKHVQKTLGARLCSFLGGDMRNAIPRESVAVLAFAPEHEQALAKTVSQYDSLYKQELSGSDAGVTLAFKKVSSPGKAMNLKDQKAFVDAVYACPSGVMRMSDAVAGLVETSTNLSIVRVQGGEGQAISLLRSSVDSAKEDLAEVLDSVFGLAGACTVFEGAYPGWKPNKASPILKIASQLYHERFGKMPHIKAVHAGLECGLFARVYPHWDMLSFGPTIQHPHSPDERTEIASIQKFWDFLVAVLQNAPER